MYISFGYFLALEKLEARMVVTPYLNGRSTIAILWNS